MPQLLWQPYTSASESLAKLTLLYIYRRSKQTKAAGGDEKSAVQDYFNTKGKSGSDLGL